MASTGFVGEHGSFYWSGYTLTSANSPNLTGYDGSGWGVENVYSFSLVETTPALDVTTFTPDGGYTDAVYGLVTVTGTVNCYLSPTDILPTGDRWVASGIFTTHITGVYGTSSAQTWAGYWLVTRATTTVPVNGVNTVSFDVQNKGRIYRTLGA